MPSKTPNADCLAHGWDGVAQNQHKALRWFRRAAPQGDAQALFYRGCIYETGEGVPADLVETERLYILAAALGHAEATRELSAA